MDSAEIETLRRALVKRGFKKDDAYYHVCEACTVKAVEKYVVLSRLGGRDIDLCCACGAARSWSRRAGSEERAEEENFDLKVFLRL